LKTDSSIEVFNCKCLQGVWFQLSLQNKKTFPKCVSLYPKSSLCVGAQIHCKIQSCNFDSSFYVKCIISNTRLRRWLILHIILIKPQSNYEFVVVSRTTEEIVIETFKYVSKITIWVVKMNLINSLILRKYIRNIRNAWLS
jgi:hypothetical protein